MYIAFQGGVVKAELVNSALYLKARDLLAILFQNIDGGLFKGIDTRSNITYNTTIEKIGRRPTRYIALQDVLSFLDAVHDKTRIETIMLMQEFIHQFKKQLTS